MNVYDTSALLSLLPCLVIFLWWGGASTMVMVCWFCSGLSWWCDGRLVE